MTAEEKLARRRWLGGVVVCGLTAVARGAETKRNSRPGVLRIGTTPVILDDQIGFLDAWRAYLEARLGRPVLFVQRGSYREIIDLLVSGQLDAAWVCGYPYARYRTRMRLLAVPLYNGKPLYRSYLIVPSTNADVHSILDLRGRVFAYSDPNSNSGFLVSQYELLRANEDPRTFFRKTFFTYAHRKVVVAVAAGVAHGGAVDGYVWDTLARLSPELTARTRVAWRSMEFGFPPLVVRADLPADDLRELRQILIAMPENDEGRALLRQLNIDGFSGAVDGVFDGIAQMMRFVDGRVTLLQ